MKTELVKDFLPPSLIRQLRKVKLLNPGPHWSGDFPSWEDALTRSTGYDSKNIVEKVKESLLKVKKGEAVYERDSVLFPEIQYTWPILAFLLWIYAQKGKLNLVDFGGSLGSTYFQNRKFLRNLANVHWNIVEQKTFVDVGIEHFQDEKLRFYHDIQAYLNENNADCILLSSVLPYISNPYELLTSLFEKEIPFVVVDKMPFIAGRVDRITIQKTPRSIYEASYPAWFFSESKFKEFVNQKYDLIEEFICKDEANIKSVYKGMVFKLK